ncbi:putative tetracycline-efflux transporter [Diplocarpon rosae]|nr:putative tetracycline-efflux transporter [Diplocarpon rosae]
MPSGNNNSDGEGQSRQTGKIWGAQSSLRKYAAAAGLKSQGSDEVTPLLASGSTSPSGTAYGNGHGNGNSKAPEWEGYADYEGLTWWYKPSMYWLLPPFFFYALAAGGILVPKLNMILSLVCREYFIEKSSATPHHTFTPVLLGSDNPQCRIPEVQALATKFTLYMTIIAGTLSAVMSPKLGALSDRYGRLNFLTITSLGAFIGEIITILAGRYPETFSYQWILVGSVFDGLCGSFTAGMALTHAYAADCTPPPKRAVAFGYFHACLFSGIAVGPLFAAFLVKVTGSILTTFYMALGIHAAFIAFLLLVVPESLTTKRQNLARELHAAERIPGSESSHPKNSLGKDSQTALLVFFNKINILSPLKILWPTGHGTSSALRANLILLSLVDTVVFGVAMGAVTVSVYYLGFQFAWGTPEISVFTSLVNICRVSALIIVLPLLNYVVRTRRADRELKKSGLVAAQPNTGSDTFDLAIIRVAVVADIVGYVGYAVSRTPALFVLAGIFASLGAVGSPTLQSALTKHVPHDRVGQLLGATGLLHALARVVCPVIFNLIYANTVGTFPQAVFVVLAASFVIAAGCSWFIKPNIYLANPVTLVPDHQSSSVDPEILVDEEITGI